jgi:hypothetical protein
MAGLKNRFSSLFEDEEDEITTVIKETDDDSPNTRTTTIKRAGEKGRAPTKGNTLLSEMESIVREFEGYPNQMGIGTNGYEPRNFVENTFLQEPGEGVPSIPSPYQPSGYDGQRGRGTGVEETLSPPNRIIDRLGVVNGGVRLPQPQTFTGMNSPMGPVETPVDTSGMPQTFTGMGSPFESPPVGMGSDPEMGGMITPGVPGGSTAAPDGFQGIGGDPSNGVAMSGEQIAGFSGDDYTPPDRTPRGPDLEAVERERARKHYLENLGGFGGDAYGGSQPTEEEINQSKLATQQSLAGAQTTAPGTNPTTKGPVETPGGHTAWQVSGAKTPAQAVKTIAGNAVNDQSSYTVNNEQPNMAQGDALKRTWGKLVYDPKKRRDEYMKRLNKIYANTMALEALAIVSGKRSRAGMYSKMAMGKLDAMQKFDSEDRLQQLTNSLYFNKNGEYAPPANKAEAHAALMQMGASLNEATAIVGHVPEAVAQDLKEWYRYNPQTNQIDTRQYSGKKGSPGAGWTQKYEVANNKKKDANPGAEGIGTGTEVANAQYITIQEALLADMTPGTVEYANQERFIRTLKDSLDIGGGMDKAFKTMYGSMINDGDKPPKINGVQYESWEAFKKAWQDPDNNGPNSYNTYVGGDPKNSGMVTEAAQVVSSFDNERDAMMAALDGKIKNGDRVSIGGVTGTWK